MILSTPNDLIEMENQVKKLTQDLEQTENERFELELRVVELKKGTEERSLDLIGLENKVEKLTKDLEQTENDRSKLELRVVELNKGNKEVKKLSINLERKEVEEIELKKENKEKTIEIEQMKQLLDRRH